jgi:hypothetical protein
MQEEREWMCTDPNNLQYGKKVAEGHYVFREFDRNNYLREFKYFSYDTIHLLGIWSNDEYWIEMDIVLKHYESEEIEDHVSAYHKNVEEVKEIYGDDAEWIIAECIFEQESLLY